jgi:ATP-dependent helicase HrpA
VARRLFKSIEEASAATREGTAALLERQLGHDLMWTQRDLRALRELGALTALVGPIDELQGQAFALIRTWVIARPIEPPTAAVFATVLDRAKSDLRGLVPRFTDLLREILTLRQEVLVLPDPPPGLLAEAEALAGPNFLRTTPYARLPHLPRYLRALKLRHERARKQPAKDAERAAQVAAYERAWQRLPESPGREALRWLLQEFRVSLFAQELGTAEPVSTVKLDRAFAALQPVATTAIPLAAPKPIVASAPGKTKVAPVKNLNALDRLFQR